MHERLRRELELNDGAGLSTADVLPAAGPTSGHGVGLADRGVIEPGRRADLVLLDGDPIADIRATRSIRRIWIGGIEHEPAEAKDQAG